MAEIQLHSGSTTAKVITQGAQITSLCLNNRREVIWQGNLNVWDQHAPILFPICGAVKNDRISIGGEYYPMPKHGFTGRAEFTVGKQGDDFVELIYTPTAEAKKYFPFDYVLHVTYTILENGFTTTMLVENLSDRVMPFCIGGHPGFIVPMESGATFADYQLVFPKKENGRTMLVPNGSLIDGSAPIPGFEDGMTLPLSYELMDRFQSLIIDDLQSRSVKLVHRISGRGIHVDFPKIEALVIWTSEKHADYLCIEPWQGLPAQTKDSDCFEDKPFAIQLAPGKCYKTWFTSTMI